ncbi:MAG: tetratricopeptide repeat protein [Smithellaceae bacterium]|jgi:tetratricopeptide (TPR) repeat protein
MKQGIVVKGKTVIIMIVFISMLGLIMACASPPIKEKEWSWYKPNFTQEGFAKDKYDCMQQAQQTRSFGVGGVCNGVFCQPGVAGSRVETNVDLFNACMEARGWSLVEQKQYAASPTPSQIGAKDWINKAIALWDGGKCSDPEKAIEYLNNAIKLQPDFAEAYYSRGRAYHDLGQYQRAIEDYTKAISLKPDFAFAYSSRGSAYLNKGNNNIACTDVRKACELGECKLLEWAKGKGLCR